MNKENESGYGQSYLNRSGYGNCSGYGFPDFASAEWGNCTGMGRGMIYGYCEWNNLFTDYGDGESNGSGNEDFTGESVNTVI